MEYFESSSSSSKPVHVYISFRADDDGTRRFIHRLSAGLKAKGLSIFGDDKKHEREDSDLPSHLRRAIEHSWILIVVFSKHYASSSWCLEELAAAAGIDTSGISEEYTLCVSISKYVGSWSEEDTDKVNMTMKQMVNRTPDGDVEGWVIPVYYDVDRSFVQHVEERMAAHIEEKVAKTNEHIKELLRGRAWRRPRFFKEVMEIIGWEWDSRAGSELQVIHEIVRVAKERKDRIFYGYFNYVGIHSRVEEAEKLLDLRWNDEVQIVGICGMSGIGKSSLAAVLYLKIFHYFDAFCFLPNITRRLKHGGLSLQELLHRNLETENSEIRDILGKQFLTCKRSRNHKFLIVLDGVDSAQDIQELVNLVEKSNCFGRGSRIIITTRDQQVLQKSKVEAIYMPELLTRDEAFQLFRSEAFDWAYPYVGDYEEMIQRVLEYANGLPLAIKILGSFLYGKSAIEWRSFLNREEIIPPLEMIMVLKKCFDELDNMSKEIFLDISCFFTGKDVNYVKEILCDCGFSIEKEIDRFVEKSLMTISNQQIQMHGILRAVGREIVRQECPLHPEYRSRLFLLSDIKHVMKHSRYCANDNIGAIVLDMEEPKGAKLRIEALSRMNNLRLLIFRNVKFSGTLDNLSSNLRYVSWHQYPFTCLPSSFQSDALVQLIMPDSNITKVWNGKMMLPKLRNMNLCGSKDLIESPNFEGVPNLERLDLEGCIGLLRFHPSIAKLSKLKFLNLRNCTNLNSIPNCLFSLDSLKVLNLACCSRFAYCLNFSPSKSLAEVNLSIWSSSLLENLPRFR